MASSHPSPSPSGATTPNVPPATSTSTTTRFAAPASTAEDLLKSQTVGLVQLSDFRKRRAEALERTEREVHDRLSGRFSGNESGASTPRTGASTPLPVKKKARKNATRGKISFATDDDDDGEVSTVSVGTSRAVTPNDVANSSSSEAATVRKRKMMANSAVSFAPKALTKSALLREAQTRDQLRKEFLAIQEAVKSTEIAIPFVFYDGTNIPGGVCKIKKGEQVWLFLDKARKVGAELGVGGDKGKKLWARVSVDDLLLVRKEIIIPHHYDFYYFIVNKTNGFSGRLFNYSAEPSQLPATATDEPEANTLSIRTAGEPRNKNNQESQVPDSELEGYSDDPNMTKVVDRRWYERNKHIFPSNMWEEFNPEKDYTQSIRKDASGNTLFF